MTLGDFYNLSHPTATPQPTTPPAGNQTGDQGTGFQPIGSSPAPTIQTSAPTSSGINLFTLNDTQVQVILLTVCIIIILIIFLGRLKFKIVNKALHPIFLIKNILYRTASSLNNKQKGIWSIYLSLMLISLIFLLTGGNLWKPFMNNDCDYYRFVQLDCIRQENITIALLLLIPSFILHKLWKDKKP